MNLRWLLSHARGYMELGMIREAEEELAKVSPDDSDRSEVHAVRVSLLHVKRDWARLRKLALDLVDRFPDEPGWWVSLAFATRRSISLKSAHDILLTAEKTHPDEAIIQFNLGCYECQLGDLAEARRRVERSIALQAEFREIARHDPDLAPLRAAEPKLFG